MSDNENTPEDEIQEEAPVSELDLLKGRARSMGITFSGNIGKDALKKKINDKLSGSSDDEEEETEEEEVAAAPKDTGRRKTKAEKEQEIRDGLYKEKMRLRRVQIYNLNPAKNELAGEIIAVGNKYLGTIKRFIPFGESTEGGTHIEQVLYDELKSRRFQQLRFKKGRDGERVPESRWVPEYNLVELPPLTKEELAELALTQEAAKRVNND